MGGGIIVDSVENQHLNSVRGFYYFAEILQFGLGGFQQGAGFISSSLVYIIIYSYAPEADHGAVLNL